VLAYPGCPGKEAVKWMSVCAQDTELTTQMKVA